MTDASTQKIDPDKLKDAAKAIADFGRSLQEISRRVNVAVESVRPLILPFVESLRVALDELPPKLRKVYVGAANHGWYLPWDIPITAITPLISALDSATPEELDDMFSKLFAEYPEKIGEEVGVRFPQRKTVLAEAVEAHRRGSYALSTLAFLVQAEGIAIELGLPSPYENKDYALKSSKLLHGSIAPFDAALLAPLIEVDALRIGLREVHRRRLSNASAVPLNRHEVVHGRRSDYGSEHNSVRAALLLGYVLYVGQRASERATRMADSGR